MDDTAATKSAPKRRDRWRKKESYRGWRRNFARTRRAALTGAEKRADGLRTVRDMMVQLGALDRTARGRHFPTKQERCQSKYDPAECRRRGCK